MNWALLKNSLLVGGLIRAGLDPALRKQSADLQSFVTFLISALSFQGVGLILITVFLKSNGTTWKQFLGLDVTPWRRAIYFALATSVLAIPLTIALNGLCAQLINFIQHQKPEEQLVIKVLQNLGSPLQQVFFGFSAIVLAPIVEESLFRGILYRFIKQLGYPMLALSGTSLVFAAIHSNLMTFVPLTFLAMILVLLYERTQTLLAPIILHSAFNAVNFVLLLLQKNTL
jgi:membrane protease YdiL (CAAX protease family)